MELLSNVPRRVIVLDDNEIDRETCTRYLRRSPIQRYEIIEHNSVEGGLELVRKEQPDCILLDYHLHDGNGVEFLRSLAELGGTRVFPVVMLTGTGSESIAVEAMKAGAQDYLEKDRLNADLLHRTVDAAIYKAQTERLLDRQQAEMERLFRETQDANARKDQFLATLSHELRTPLTPVLAAVSATNVETANREELKEIFSVIRRNIELEARLIDDMLDLTRISSGKLEIALRLADFHPILVHAVETCAEDITTKNLRLDWHLDATRHAGRVDSARLQQVFWNLLKNAVKFTPQNGRITISTRDVEEDQIEIEVADDGIGIHPEMLEKIFDAFEQGDPRMTRQYGGVGLGLAISKALIEAHDGSIGALNHENGPGARFIVRLPAELPVEDTSAVAAAQVAASPSTKASERPFTLLLVEDHVDSAALFCQLLRMSGYDVHMATSLHQAIEVFQREAIDGVISDIGLPDGSGVELMEKLTAIRPVPGIALSGYGMEEDLRRSEKAGFLRHLTKPVDWPKLEEAIHLLEATVGRSA